MAVNTFKLEFEDGVSKSLNVKVVGFKDIIMFVPGTTDPLNTTNLKHQANKNYWRNSQENFWGKVKKLKPQFLDLHIEDTFFSWSGDNNTQDRNNAADRLLDLFSRVYSGFKNKDVHIHLVGHSHGGNVINQFTELIASDSRFPELWKIKSITYLSTPFFQKKHQLNSAKLHGECKIINVHNDYDITQRFIADFSLNNLEGLIQKLNSQKFKNALNEIEKTNFDTFKILAGFVVENKTEGPKVWSETVVLLNGVNKFIDEIIDYIDSFKPKKLQIEVNELRLIFEKLKKWVTSARNTFDKNKTNRDGGYGRNEFVKDANFIEAFKLLNTLFKIDKKISTSYLLDLLARVFKEKKDITDSIDDTSWTPKKQVQNKFNILDLDITNKDEFHSKNKKNDFEEFAKGVENSMKKNDLAEVLMRLFSQFINPKKFGNIISAINYLLEPLVWGQLDSQLTILRKNLEKYHSFVEQFNKDLTIKESNNDGHPKLGSVPYFATTAHSLSHSELWSDVEKELKSAFSSGKNPGYKK